MKTENAHEDIGPRYRFLNHIGQGSYGIVSAYHDSVLNQRVAVKKMQKVKDDVEARKILREIKILGHYRHEKIVKLHRIITRYDPQNNFKMFLVMDCFDSDLRNVMKHCAGQLTEDHKMFIMYQLVLGMNFLHSANLIHRDLKPGNILFNGETSEICICDFGFARTKTDDIFSITEYVVTRPYRAPEVMLTHGMYSKEVDIWSLGCIFYELLTGQHLFTPHNFIEHIKRMVEIFGTPDEDFWSYVDNEIARKYVLELGFFPKRRISQFIAGVKDPATLDLLDRLLEFDPRRRITIDEAFRHPYFAKVMDVSDVRPPPKDEADFSFEYDLDLTYDELWAEILKEVQRINADLEQGGEKMED